MKHELYFDGTLTEYSWSIKTENKIVNQIREHPPAYLSGGKLDVKDKQQSKFIAIHVGVYWGLGVFIIKDHDVVNVMCDSEEIHDLMTQNRKVDDQIINDKIYFNNFNPTFNCHLGKKKKYIPSKRDIKDKKKKR